MHNSATLSHLQIDFVPVLGAQRALHDVPRGWDRFQQYLQTMTGGGDDIILPLGLMNPMGKPHVAERLDELIALGAEEEAADAAFEARERLAHVDDHIKVALVMADDAQGGWTDRHYSEILHRFKNKGELKRDWATVVMWSGESPPLQKIRSETLAAIYRALYQRRFGFPTTLEQMLRQEGLTGHFAEGDGPTLSAAEFSDLRTTIAPYRDSEDLALIFSCLYGDEAAERFGYRPLGLPSHAGYALARTEAEDTIPEQIFLAV